jgi:hypothetical protein
MATRNRRRPTNAPRPELARKEPPPRRSSAAGDSASRFAGTGIPDWQWLTTPVMLAFALGGLIGTFGGGAAVGIGNGLPFLALMGTFAMIFGLSMGRVLRRWIAIRRLNRIRGQGG